LRRNLSEVGKGEGKGKIAPPRDCKTLMMVVGLVWSNESRSYAGGSIATGRASHARLARDEDPDKEAIQSVLQDCWGLDVRLTTCSGKKYCYEIQRSNGRTVRNRDGWQKLLRKTLAQKGLLCR
jgi:hypothetical protein